MSSPPSETHPDGGSWFRMLAPGILIAATGVGAGDLMMASLAGSHLGVTLLWAAWMGAILKWTLNEGLARWQMATGTTLLEGWVQRLGGWIQWVFLGYLLLWSLVVGGALVNACGVAGAGLFPIVDNPEHSKRYWGVAHALIGLALVWIGGFRLFQRLMAVCIAVMFVTVLLTTALLSDVDWSAVASGLKPRVVPADQVHWVVGLLGGVGGTVTLLSYGYWIREEDRQGSTGVRTCRIDLAVGYGMTALFGMAMIIIGSQVELEGKGATLAPILADKLAKVIGAPGRWLFLIGFWGAVFSSLLGVWQSVPYLFADFISLRRGEDDSLRRDKDFTQSRAYRTYLIGIALLPLPLLWLKVTQVQLAYAVLGALFMPLLALTLLIMNNRTAWVGRPFRSGVIVNLLLIATLAYFAAEGGRTIYEQVVGLFTAS